MEVDGLHGRLLENVLAVGVKPKVPETDIGHEPVGLLHLAVGAKQSLDELDAGALAQLAFLLGLVAGTQHGSLTGLEELPELVRDPVAGLDELLDHLPVVLGPDLGDDLLGALDLPGKLDEEEPQLAGLLADGGTGTMVVDGPVIDPFAQGVGIEDAAEQHDGLLGGIPVLERVARGDPVPLGIGLRGLAGHRGWRWWLLVHGGGPGGLGPLRHRGRVAAHVASGRGRAALRLVPRGREAGLSVEEGTALRIVAVISSMPTSVDSEVILVWSRPRPPGHNKSVAAEIDELVVGFPLGDRGRMVGKRRATLARGARRTRKTRLAWPRDTHIDSGVLAVARVPGREGRSTRAGKAAVDATGAPVAEVCSRRGPLRRRGVVVARSPGRWRRGRAGELLPILVVKVLLAGSGPVGGVVGHGLWLLRCPPRHPNGDSAPDSENLSCTPQPLRGVDGGALAQLKIRSRSRVCRDAGKSDTRHLGLWSVGRGEENRLLIANMSRMWCFYLRSENRASKSRARL